MIPKTALIYVRCQGQRWDWAEKIWENNIVLLVFDSWQNFLQGWFWASAWQLSPVGCLSLVITVMGCSDGLVAHRRGLTSCYRYWPDPATWLCCLAEQQKLMFSPKYGVINPLGVDFLWASRKPSFEQKLKPGLAFESLKYKENFHTACRMLELFFPPQLWTLGLVFSQLAPSHLNLWIARWLFCGGMCTFIKNDSTGIVVVVHLHQRLTDFCHHVWPRQLHIGASKLTASKTKVTCARSVSLKGISRFFAFEVQKCPCHTPLSALARGNQDLDTLSCAEWKSELV